MGEDAKPPDTPAQGSQPPAEPVEPVAPDAERSTLNAERAAPDPLAAAEAKAAEYLALAQRVQADFLNFRKRIAKEKDEVRAAVARDWAAALLPVLDHLHLAEAAGGDAETIRQGVRMIAGAFTQALAQLGVEPVESVGQPFDPTRHEAIGTVATTEHPPGTVVAEARRGWSFAGRVLRAPRVQVAAAPAPPEDAP